LVNLVIECFMPDLSPTALIGSAWSVKVEGAALMPECET
jgi:hypothetical protein